MILFQNLLRNSNRAASFILVAFLFLYTNANAQTNVDISVTQVVNPLGAIRNGGQKTLSVRVRNVGNVAITTVKLGWKLNGVAQPDVTAPVTLPVPSNATQISVASVTLSTNYIDNLNNTIEVFVKEAQNQTDVNPLNDTLRATFGAPLTGGVKTIGVLNSDYKNFTEAINALRYNGLANNITFKVKAGAYSDNIELNISEIFLPNGSKQIIFESESGKKDVIIISEAAQQVTVRLNGVDDLILRNMRLINRNIVSGIGVQLLGSANRNTISNCEITVDSISNSRGFVGILAGTIGTTANNFALGTVAAARYLTLSNNKISGGYYGIATSGPGAQRDTGLVIEKNTINQVSFYGVYVNFSTNAKISQNNVTLRPSADLKSVGYFLTNISTAAPGNIQVTRNYVSNAGLYGIYLSSVTGTGAPTNRYVNIYNNMVAGGFFNNFSNATFSLTETPVGLYMANCGWSNVYFNSIYMDAPTKTNLTDNTTAFFIAGTTGNGTTRVYNNIFSNANKGYAYYNNSATASNPVTLSDNNDLYVALLDTNNNPTSGFAFWNTLPRTSLRDLSSVSLRDRNSFSKDPLFFSTTDLHTLSADLDQKGSTVPLTEVPIDFDGDIRDQVNLPDVGADEFGPGGEDFAIVGVAPDVFRFNRPTAWRITVRYQGPTNGNKLLYFNYMIDGAEQLDPDSAIQFQFTQLSTNFRTQTFTVPIANYITRTTYQSFKLKAYISAGNFGDLRTYNDTTEADVCVGLEGTFSIDKNAPPSTTNFTSFQEVYDYLKCGVSGPTIFEIADGVYDEQISLWKIRNSSATNTITFKSKNDVFSTRLTYVNGTAENHATILFNNAQYIILRDLTIENRSLANGTCIQFAGNSRFNEIRNNIIKVDSTLTPFPTTLLPIIACKLGTLNSSSLSYATNAQNNIIANNKIFGGFYGVAMYGLDSDKRDLNNIVERNTITSFHKAGIYLDFSDTRVRNNVIAGKFGMDNNAWGIYAKGLGDRAGLFTNDISGNKIYDITFQGIHLFNCLGLKTPGAKKSTFVISNNMIGGGFTFLSTTTSGIFLNTTRGISILHNTVLMDAPRTSTTTISKTVARCFIVNSTNEEIESLNNIFYSTNGAIAMEFHAKLRQGNVKTGLVASDNNLYYTSFVNRNTPLILILRFGNTQSSQNSSVETPVLGYNFSQLSQSSLVALNNYKKVGSNSSRDRKSLALPLLFEELPYNLHTYDLTVESKAAGGLDITDDFDKEPRKSRTPDIGCDEFTVPNIDLQIRKIVNPLLSALKPNKIVVELRNRGRYSLDNQRVALKYTVSDIENGFSSTSTDTVLLKLPKPGDSQTYTFKRRVSVPRRGTYEVCVEKVNGWIPLDTVFYNNKACANLCTGIEGDYYIGFDKSNPLPGTNPARYYTSVQKALDDVTCGIADVTWMYLNPDSSPYLGRIVIPKFLVNLDSPLLNILPYGTTNNTAVLLQQPSSPTGDADKLHYTVRLNGSNFVRLLNLNIKNTGANFGSALHITRNAKNNIVEGCKIEVNSTSNSQLFYPVAFTSSNKLNILDNNSYAKNGTENRIVRNTIIGGYSGISLLGASLVDFDLNNIIDSNIIQDFFQFGIYSANNTIKRIGFNQLTPRATSSNLCVSISYNFAGEGGLINANKLINSKQIGIKLYGIDGFLNNRLIVSNNWITNNFGTSVADTASAILIKRSNNLGIYYNSIRYNGFVSALNFSADSLVLPPTPPEVTPTVVYFRSSNIQVRNNIIQIDSVSGALKKPYAVYFNSNDPTSEFEHNAYHTGYLSRFGYFPPRNQRDFEIWQQNTSKDLTSYSYSTTTHPDSIYLSRFDMNLVDTTRFDKKGIVVAGINRDYNNRKRSPRITDIGSIEYERVPLDVSLFQIVNEKAVYGTNTFTVKILNEGYENLSSKSIVLEYSLDSGITWTGRQTVTLTDLKARYDEQLFSFSTKHVKTNFVLIPLCVRIAPDGRLQNDTITKFESICKDLCVGLEKGEYTVGKNGTEDFSNFQQAITALICGFDSSIVFKVSPGTYMERFSIPDIATAADTTVTFVSSTNNPEDVILEYTNNSEDVDHHVVRLDGSRYITFKGLTFTSKAKARASGIHIADTAKFITVDNCIFRFDSVSNINTLVGVLASGKIAYTDPAQASSNVIRNSKFYGGAFGIRLLGIKNNAFSGANKIVNNTFYGNNTAAIDVFYTQIDSVSDNNIDMRKTNPDGVGINIYGALTDFLIIGNKIKNAQNIGLVIDSCRTISKGLIANNMIAGGFVGDGNKNDCGFLLKSVGAFPDKGVNSSGFIDIVNNSVLYDGINDSASAFNIQISNSLNIFNNIFANYGNGYAIKYTTEENSVPQFNEANTNLLYTKGSVLANWKGELCVNLADLGLKDLGNAPFNIGKSPKGLGEFDPKFKSKYDLHVNNTMLDGAGTPMDLVTTDIDGEKRNASTPDVGCDEYFPGFDIGVTEFITPIDQATFKDTVRVIVRVKNFGADVNSIKVKYTFDGVLVDSATRTLSPSMKLDSTSLVLFTKRFSTRQAGPHVIKAYTEIKKLNENNVFVNNDFNTLNDTSTIVVFSKDTSDIGASYFLSPLNGISIKQKTPVQVAITNYGNLAASNFKIALKVNNRVKEVMNVVGPLKGKETKEYQFNYQIDPDSAVFFDVCATTYLFDDVIEANDSNCIVSLTLGVIESSADKGLFSVHPNPTNAMLNFGLDLSAENNVQIQIFDVSGRLMRNDYVYQVPAGKQKIEMNYEELAEGTYFFVLTTDDKKYNGRFVIIN
jgi:hypothetical protein